MRGLKHKSFLYGHQQDKSHLLQMRGLKLCQWKFFCFWRMSHLLQMRGLKLISSQNSILIECRIFYRCVDWNLYWTLLIRFPIGRIFYRCVDWNSKGCTHGLSCGVASFTDAWIETLHLLKRLWKRKVASFTDAWIETNEGAQVKSFQGRIFYRCVDWNLARQENRRVW